MSQIRAKFRSGQSPEYARQLLSTTGVLASGALDDLVGGLANSGVAFTSGAEPLTSAVAVLSRNGFVVFSIDGIGDSVQLVPCRADFEVRPVLPIEAGPFKMARLAYIHAEDGALSVRHPAADCFLRAANSQVMALLARFSRMENVARISVDELPFGSIAQLCGLFARAAIIQPCDDVGRTADEMRPERRQWDFHDALFHSQSRLGRTQRPVGATWAFKNEIQQAPAVKEHPWNAHVIPLPRPDVAALMMTDMPLTRAIETRRSVRSNSIVPLSSAELGAFLFRTMRVRARTQTADGDFAWRPYPGGGAIYENEIYVTIDRCLDLPRGFYYYDPLQHALCLISWPDWNLEWLLEEARMATAGICRPQILLTIASRHTRFGWKYSGMSYAAQLKNVGVIYQTMYLVATAMDIGGCALGLGNTDRFLAMTGLDWFEEGSVGEFLIGRPL